MKKNNRLLKSLEDIVYNSEDKISSDFIIKRYTHLFNIIDLTDCRAYIANSPIRLVFYHKAFADKKLTIYLKNDIFYFMDNPIEEKEINKLVKKIFEELNDKKAFSIDKKIQ